MMNKFEYINTNLKYIRNQINNGIIFPSVLSHFEAYQIYSNYLNEGFNKGESTRLAAKDTRRSMHYIQSVRRDMEREMYSVAEETEHLRSLRKKLAKKGYSLVGNSKKGYAIRDKYSKITNNVSSLSSVDVFLMEYWKVHFDKIIKKKIPSIR